MERNTEQQIHIKNEIMIDLNTFGNENVSEKLARVLNEIADQQLTKHVLKLISTVNMTLKPIMINPESLHYHKAQEMIKKVYLNHVYKIIDDSELINSHIQIKNLVKNVVKIQFSKNGFGKSKSTPNE